MLGMFGGQDEVKQTNKNYKKDVMCHGPPNRFILK